VPDDLLASLRVLDLSDDDGDAVTRLLADLGADVLKVEPPGGSPSRTRRPTLGGTGVRFALHNANKRSTVLDPSDPQDCERLIELAGGADIVVDSGTPGQAAAYGTSCEDLADCFPQLVSMSVTDFGRTGPRSSWRATIRCCMRCRGRWRGRVPPRGHRSRRRTVSRRPPPPFRPPGQR